MLASSSNDFVCIGVGIVPNVELGRETSLQDPTLPLKSLLTS